MNSTILLALSTTLTNRGFVNSVEHPGYILTTDLNYNIAFGTANPTWGMSISTFQGREVSDLQTEISNKETYVIKIADAFAELFPKAEKLIEVDFEKNPHSEWAKEFGTSYPVPEWLDRLALLGFCEDTSYRHDVCPTFRFINASDLQNILILAVHPDDVSKREDAEVKRFMLFWAKPEEAEDQSPSMELATESEEEVQATLANYNFMVAAPISDREINDNAIMRMTTAERDYAISYLESFSARWNYAENSDRIDHRNKILDLLTKELDAFFPRFALRPQCAGELLLMARR